MKLCRRSNDNYESVDVITLYRHTIVMANRSRNVYCINRCLFEFYLRNAVSDVSKPKIKTMEMRVELVLTDAKILLYMKIDEMEIFHTKTLEISMLSKI